MKIKNLCSPLGEGPLITFFNRLRRTHKVQVVQDPTLGPDTYLCVGEITLPVTIRAWAGGFTVDPPQDSDEWSLMLDHSNADVSADVVSEWVVRKRTFWDHLEGLRCID